MDNHEKENALNIVTEERTYHIYAESPEDARYSISIYSISTNLWLFYEWCLTLCKHDVWKVPPCGCEWKFTVSFSITCLLTLTS